ncbi:DUF397 domain-containing protein [Streptomyces triticiradicis]|uniref:DUF397 domain-containing protein n=1 Tax=Streptomyces triticiradicis TaxID=2651189 RepID=A0A7J5DK64_9ACTN|nr:DUF397 domain-containing protein [Streptomyces triticiradicis]KAB1989092.1 DUF397 domain-containing protein [Streptomyces triticiradicis]
MQGATELTWVKSTYSSGEGGDCIEVATDTNTVHVRDSKDTARRGLTVGADAWAMFVDHMGNELG